MVLTVFVDADETISPSQPTTSNNKRKLSLFNPINKRSSRLSSLLSLSSSRKSTPTCTISLECATTNVPSHNTDSECLILADAAPVDVNVIPFPSSSDAEPDLDSIQLDAVVKVRRRSMQATPRSSLERTRTESLERTQERPRKASLAKRKPARRPLVHHTLLAPSSHIPSRKRLPHIKQSDLRFLSVVRRSVQQGLDERMVDQESDLQEQDRLFVLRLGEQLAERGIRVDADTVLSPSQIVATATLRRRESAAVRCNTRTPLQRRPSPLATSA